jgi:hypothetical protein
MSSLNHFQGATTPMRGITCPSLIIWVTWVSARKHKQDGDRRCDWLPFVAYLGYRVPSSSHTRNLVLSRYTYI